MATSVVSPVGRIVQGSAHRPSTTDAQGKPLLYKSGANMGQPREEFLLVLAIEKTNPEWPAFWGELAKVAQQAFPAGEFNAPTFSWKVKDGDGIDQNGKDNKLKDGFKGCWIVTFKSSYAVQCWYKANSHDAKTIRTGDYVRVMASVEGNGGGTGAGVSKNGIYLNHNAIEFVGFGVEIQSGPDGREAFAKAPVGYVPPGVSAMPVGGSMAAGPSSGPPALSPAGAAVITHAPQVQTGAPPSYTVPVAGTPGAAFASPAAAAPAPLAVPAAPPAPTALPAVIDGVPLQAWLDKGWTETTLRAHGKIA